MLSKMRTSSTPVQLLALDQKVMEAFVRDLGWPMYRSEQILRWLYQGRVRNIDEMTDLSLTDRRQLESVATIARAQQQSVVAAEDGTRKILLTLEDGQIVESVLIPEGNRLTLCLSTQIGCTLDCRFCLTARMGLKRNLKAHEIVDQVLTAQDYLTPGQQLTNVVLMGMGEPLANFDAVADAVTRMTNRRWGLGVPPRRITLSTAGLATRIKDVATLGINLAVSLNATTEPLRARLMPTASRLHSLKSLLAACRRYPLPPHRRLTFEYVLLSGVNDHPDDAVRLGKFLNGMRCKINLIPFNEFPGSGFTRPSDAAVAGFQAELRRRGFDVFVRKSRGRDVLGACGQLGRLPSAPRLVALTRSETDC